MFNHWSRRNRPLHRQRELSEPPVVPHPAATMPNATTRRASGHFIPFIRGPLLRGQPGVSWRLLRRAPRTSGVHERAWIDDRDTCSCVDGFEDHIAGREQYHGRAEFKRALREGGVRCAFDAELGAQGWSNVDVREHIEALFAERGADLGLHVLGLLGKWCRSSSFDRRFLLAFNSWKGLGEADRSASMAHLTLAPTHDATGPSGSQQRLPQRSFYDRPSSATTSRSTCPPASFARVKARGMSRSSRRANATWCSATSRSPDAAP